MALLCGRLVLPRIDDNSNRAANQSDLESQEANIVSNPRATIIYPVYGRDVSNQTNTGTETRWANPNPGHFRRSSCIGQQDNLDS